MLNGTIKNPDITTGVSSRLLASLIHSACFVGGTPPFTYIGFPHYYKTALWVILMRYMANSYYGYSNRGYKYTKVNI